MQENDYIPIASLNQFAFCSHRFWRMFCAGEFAENQYTIEGSSLHERVHTLGEENRGETWQVRAIWLRSDTYQLVGKADLIESEDGRVYPVEYKRGQRGDWENDQLQVVAQALCLEDMTGHPVELGYVYYAQSHQRHPVEISPELRQKTQEIIQEIVKVVTQDLIPLPVYSPRCKGCSLFSQCLPKASEKVSRYREE